MEAKETTGELVAQNFPAGQWHTMRTLESGSVILECKDGPYEPLGPKDILESGLIDRLNAFLESEAHSCSMDFGCISPLYVYRMWGGTVALDKIELALYYCKKELGL